MLCYIRNTGMNISEKKKVKNTQRKVRKHYEQHIYEPGTFSWYVWDHYMTRHFLTKRSVKIRQA